jgi:4-oxalocrotonate tautomerase
MPHIVVKLYPGRSEEIKNRLATKIAEDVATIAECKDSAVSVAIEEIEPDDWAEKVYKPDILDKQNTIYIKPGYNPYSVS